MLYRTLFSRAWVSGLVPLLLILFLMANCATSITTRAALPLTPPPIAPQAARVGPLSNQPSSPLTTTSALTGSVALTATSAPSTTPPASLTETPGVTPTVALFILPTVTPTPPALVLLPTATPTASAPAPEADAQPAISPTRASTRRASVFAPPTLLPSATIPVLTPTVTVPPVPTLTVSTPPVTTPVTTSTVGLPLPLITNSIPLPPSYLAQGSFASQTVYTDSTIVQQQGTFTILQAAAANAYGANQHYTLRTQRAVGVLDEINVYQIDNYVMVNYTGGDWMLVRRDQGSNIVRAIQPISDLAVLFPRILNQAEFIGQEEVAGVSSLRYRVDDPAGQGARLIQPLLSLSGQIRSLKLEVWVAVPGGYVVAYNFQVEVAGARVLDEVGNEARADQAVTWTYQMTPNTLPPPIVWPLDAPTPDAFPVPGFAPGAFPMPPQTELLSLVGGVPDLVSALTPTELDTFYRTELFALGWTVVGEGGLLQCSKEGANFQLLIAEDVTAPGTLISILPGD